MIFQENVLSISLLKKMFCADTQGHKTKSEKATQAIVKIVILTLLIIKRDFVNKTCMPYTELLSFLMYKK